MTGALPGWHNASLRAMNQAGVVTGRIRFDFELGQPHWLACACRNLTDRKLLGFPVIVWRCGNGPAASGHVPSVSACRSGQKGGPPIPVPLCAGTLRKSGGIVVTRRQIGLSGFPASPRMLLVLLDFLVPPEARIPDPQIAHQMLCQPSHRLQRRLWLRHGSWASLIGMPSTFSLAYDTLNPFGAHWTRAFAEEVPTTVPIQTAEAAGSWSTRPTLGACVVATYCGKCSPDPTVGNLCRTRLSTMRRARD